MKLKKKGLKFERFSRKLHAIDVLVVDFKGGRTASVISTVTYINTCVKGSLFKRNHF